MKYCDKHNQVGFLKKPEESVGFVEIVDFLKGSHIRYALTHNLTIHDSLVKQFWQTATASTLADDTLELRATIDTLEYTITEASVRSKLQLDDASGISMLPNTKIFEGMGNMRVYNFSKLIFDGMVVNLKRVLEGYLTLLPAMLPVVAVDQSAGQADQAVDQPSPSEPLPSSSHPPVLSEHEQETEVPQSQDPTHPHVAEERTMTVDDLLQLVKKMEDVLKRRHVVLPDSEDEDAEISSKQGRNLQEEGLDEMVRNMMKDKSEVFKTPTQGKTSGEEDISPTTLEATKTLSKVASQRSKSVDKGKRYKRRKESKGKDIDTGFEDISTGFEDISTGFEDISTGFEEVNTGGLGVSTAPKRTKEQIQQEEASLAEAIRLQTLEEENTAKQVHLDALLAKRLARRKEVLGNKKKRNINFNLKLNFIEEDWDAN
ncbi:hypothetical protein Tco_1505855 [Tanacetum coccineum]